jgi:ribose transport system ATP-binding protein
VAENLFLGEASQFRNKLGLVSRRAMEQEARKALDMIRADHIHPGDIAAALDLQERKLVEVAKVMVKNPEILVVDETTTALSQKGRELLYRLMNQLKAEGRAVIFISHDLDEIKSVCDTLTVLRDGSISLVSRPDLYSAPIDRDLSLGVVLHHFTEVAQHWAGRLCWQFGDMALELPQGHKHIATAALGHCSQYCTTACKF